MKSWTRTMVAPDRSILDAIRTIDEAQSQIALVVDGERRLLGTVTDGDVRRAILHGVDLTAPVERIMNREPRVATAELSDEAALNRMKNTGVRHLPLVDGQGRVVGLRSLGDLAAAARLDNWVVLMAGGEGTRLRPLTYERPKPLVNVGGKPMLEVILQGFVDQGFHRFFLSVNYMADQVEAHFADGRRWGVAIDYLRESCKLGTAGGLRLLPGRPTLPLVVANGDLLTKLNHRGLLEFHETTGSVATMCVREFRVQVPFGVVDVDGERILDITEKPVQSFLINAGIYVLDPAALDALPCDDGPFDMPTLFRDLARAGRRVCSFPIHEYWLDVGRLSDLERADEEFHEHFS